MWWVEEGMDEWVRVIGIEEGRDERVEEVRGCWA